MREPQSFALANPPWRSIQQAADGLVPRAVRAFLGAITKLLKATPRQELADAIEQADATAAEAAVPLDTFQEALSALVDALREAMGKGGEEAARAVPAAPPGAPQPPPGVGAQFDLLNPQAQAWLEQRGAAMVREVTEQTRLGLRQSLASAFRRGLSPTDAAREVRKQIGLTRRQVVAVENYRAFLEGLARRESLEDPAPAVVDRLQRGGLQRRQLGALARTGMTPQRVEKLVSGYTERLLRERAQNIARTELLTASNQGQRELWRQAEADGSLDGGWEREWVVTKDDRLCPVCAVMAGKRAPLGGQYPGGSGGPPLHPSCRCAERLVRRWRQGLAA